MTISSIASTPSQAAQASFSLSIRSFSGPPRPEAADRVSEVRRLRHEEHDHDRHDHHRRASRHDDNESSSAAFTTLKLKIEQTFSSLTGATSSDDDNAPSAPGFEGQFRARFQLSGPDGTLQAKLKIKLDADSAQQGADFASALQGFAQTLFAALRTLYGGEQAALPAPTTDAAPVVAAPPTASAPVASNPKTGTSPVAVSGNPTSASLSIKLRLTYDSFENNLGPLVNQLAQPNLGDAFPALTSLLGDLAERFGTLQSHTAAAGASAPSLQEFLTALSASLFGPKQGASTDVVAAHPPAEASSTAAAADATTDAALPAAPVATTTTAATGAQRYTAIAEYKQVLAYSDAGSSVRLQTSLSARVVYEVA